MVSVVIISFCTFDQYKFTLENVLKIKCSVVYHFILIYLYVLVQADNDCLTCFNDHMANSLWRYSTQEL